MFSNMNIGQGVDKEGQVKMRKYMTIMDSMSEKELDETDSRKLMDINKMKRIAYGSGTSLVCIPHLTSPLMNSTLVTCLAARKRKYLIQA